MMWMIDVISKIEYYFCSCFLLSPSTGIHSQEKMVVSFVRLFENIHKTPSQNTVSSIFRFFKEERKQAIEKGSLPIVISLLCIPKQSKKHTKKNQTSTFQSDLTSSPILLNPNPTNHLFLAPARGLISSGATG